MKYLLCGLLAALVAVPATGFAHEMDDDDTNRDVKASYSFEGFDKIEITGVYLLDIQQGDQFSVRTEAREEDAEWMDVYLEGDTLILGQKDGEGKKWSRNNRNHKGILTTITMPRLSELTIAGVATGHVEAFDGGNVTVEFAGVGDLALSGTCESLDIELAGVGELDARDLVCDSVEADMGGMGSLSVHATQQVDASIGGMGSIDVYGNPEDVTTNKTMFSSIDIK